MKFISAKIVLLTGYYNIISRHRYDRPRGGEDLFIKDNLIYKLRENISLFIPHICDSLFIEIRNTHGTNLIRGVIYRPKFGNVYHYSK